jgi:superfamily II DNA/RNA helicase/very-short-patch-repair endonuclease
MNSLQTHRSILGTYRSYIESFLNIKDQRIVEKVQKELADGTLWPEPLIQFNPAYEQGGTAEQLAQEGVLHPELARILSGITLHKHQERALRLGASGQDFVVSSGTGSGKSLTFLGTIFHCILSANTGSGIKAIIVYPMNALINSQTKEIEEYAKLYTESTGRQFPITYAQYTGQEKAEVKRKILSDPPQVLLTNFVMLELLLTRSTEVGMRAAIMKNLETLVFDELHTYRGRQGSDVALLIRKIRSQAFHEVLCIGTSATMVSGSSMQEEKQAIATFASRLFGKHFDVDSVVDERLRITLPQRDITPDDVRTAVGLDVSVNGSIEELRNNTLAIWLESTVAAEHRPEGFVRGKPLTITQIAEQLSQYADLPRKDCVESIERLLEWIQQCNNQIEDIRQHVLPYKLHQFIAQTGSVYLTMEDAASRSITLEPTLTTKTHDNERVPVYPCVFSRISGHEFLCVRMNSGTHTLEPRDFREHSSEDDLEDTEDGYFISDDPNDAVWDESSDLDFLPSTWKGKDGRIDKEHRPRMPRRLYANRNGGFSLKQDTAHSLAGWFMPLPLAFDPTSGTYFFKSTSENFKLMRLGNEGRSTATTILSYAIVQALAEQGIGTDACKVLSFTDNRQDASLQAGHFNDFVRVGRLRSAVYHALQKAEQNQLDYSDIASNVTTALDLKQDEYAQEPSEFSSSRKENEHALDLFVMYRILQDLRRGWLVILPNLEQCGLLSIKYKNLDEIAGREDIWKNVPVLEAMNASDRFDFLYNLCDYFRTSYAIHWSGFEKKQLDKNQNIIREKLQAPWTLGINERIDEPNSMRVEPESVLRRRSYTESIGPRSMFGKYFKMLADRHEIKQTGDDYTTIMYTVLGRLTGGLLRKHTVLRVGGGEVELYQLAVDAIVWTLGDCTTVRPDNVRLCSHKGITPKPNTFFRSFYQQTFATKSSLIAAEHTAAIGNEQRIKREDDFRNGRIQALYCSPTMELGIDIRTLNVVHMRNAPPDPARYAQRSGRAGRSGQGAVIVTYCSQLSPHDRHYFEHRQDLVHGAVRAPRIDLANEELHRSHLQAMYLAAAEISDLEHSIKDVVDIEAAPELPIRSEIKDKLNVSEQKRAEVLKDYATMTTDLNSDLNRTRWYTDDWSANVLTQAQAGFDEAFGRWRVLWSSACELLSDAHAALDNHLLKAGSPQRKEAIQKQKIALRQRDLLLNEGNGSQHFDSEFYPFRYLASEAFLPGFNFPRLPIRTYIEGDNGGQYISRSRFQALREYGPGSVVYYDGVRYRIKQLVPTGSDQPFHKAKIVKQSGYIFLDDDYNSVLCPMTGTQLDGDSSRTLIHVLLPMGETRTEEISRISCEDEERLSAGYEIGIYFNMKGALNAMEQMCLESDGVPLLNIRYLPAATLVQINHKWRNSKDDGFLIGLKSGLWKREASQGAKEEPATEENKRVQLYTTDTADALYIEPTSALGLTKNGVVTLQYALRRAIEQLYLIEQGEIGSAALGDDQCPNILLFEAAEGSLGVLCDLVRDINAFPNLVKTAYALCGFHDGEDMNPERGPASYDDLLSYYNQRDHRIIDRHEIKDALERLQACPPHIITNKSWPDYDAQYAALEAARDKNSSTEEKFLKYLHSHRLHLPDQAQYKVGEFYVMPDFFYEPNICVFCDGSVHDSQEAREDDAKKRNALGTGGYQVLAWHYSQPLDEFVALRPDIFFVVK